MLTPLTLVELHVASWCSTIPIANCACMCCVVLVGLSCVHVPPCPCPSLPLHAQVTPSEIYLVVNAGCRDKDLEHIGQHLAAAKVRGVDAGGRAGMGGRGRCGGTAITQRCAAAAFELDSCARRDDSSRQITTQLIDCSCRQPGRPLIWHRRTLCAEARQPACLYSHFLGSHSHLVH